MLERTRGALTSNRFDSDIFLLQFSFVFCRALFWFHLRLFFPFVLPSFVRHFNGIEFADKVRRTKKRKINENK